MTSAANSSTIVKAVLAMDAIFVQATRRVTTRISITLPESWRVAAILRSIRQRHVKTRNRTNSSSTYRRIQEYANDNDRIGCPMQAVLASCYPVTREATLGSSIELDSISLSVSIIIVSNLY